MDRCGLADRICAGSGWVGIRPGAVEDFPGQMLSAYRFQVKPAHGEPSVFARESSCDSCAATKHALPEQLQSELNCRELVNVLVMTPARQSRAEARARMIPA